MHRALLLLALLVPATMGSGATSPPAGPTAARLEQLAQEIGAQRGALPPSRDGIEALVADESLLVDEWGEPVLYLRVAGGFWLMSWGADGAPGGEGDAADVVHIVR